MALDTKASMVPVHDKAMPETIIIQSSFTKSLNETCSNATITEDASELNVKRMP